MEQTSQYIKQFPELMKGKIRFIRTVGHRDPYP